MKIILLKKPVFFIFLLCLILFRCNNAEIQENTNIHFLDGHWYLSKVINQEDIPYIEFIINDNTIVKINDGGHVWDHSEIEIGSDSIFQIGSRKLKIKSYLDSFLNLYLHDDDQKEFSFMKFDSTSTCSNNFFKNITFRKLLYKISTVKLRDTAEIDDLKDNLWIEVGGVYDTLVFEEEVLITPFQE